MCTATLEPMSSFVGIGIDFVTSLAQTTKYLDFLRRTDENNSYLEIPKNTDSSDSSPVPAHWNRIGTIGIQPRPDDYLAIQSSLEYYLTHQLCTAQPGFPCVGPSHVAYTRLHARDDTELASAWSGHKKTPEPCGSGVSGSRVIYLPECITGHPELQGVRLIVATVLCSLHALFVRIECGLHCFNETLVSATLPWLAIGL